MLVLDARSLTILAELLVRNASRERTDVFLGLANGVFGDLLIDIGRN